MKKLLLSSTVMFFLCSVSFAQAKKHTDFSKEAKQKEQLELEKTKIAPISSPLPQQEANKKTVLQKLGLLKSQTKSSIFIIEPELDGSKVALPNLRKNPSH